MDGSARRSAAAVTLLLALLVLTSCGGPSARAALERSRAVAPTAAPTAEEVRSPARGIDKLLVLVVENHSFAQMREQLPFLAGLARHYGYAADYHAIRHPSLPNYLAITGGSTYGVRDDGDRAVHPVTAPSVFGQALRRGRRAKVYAEAMSTRCQTVDHGRYVQRHNPWVYHVAERRACRRLDVPVARLAGDVRRGRLPAAGMVVPDLCHDAHDCPLTVADRWLRSILGLVRSGPDWRSGRLAVVVTADEDDNEQANRVLTVVLSPQLHGRVVRRPLSHYSLARLYSEVLGARPLGHARGAPSMTRAFGLRLAR